MKSIVLLNTTVTKESKVIKELKEINHIKSANEISGNYDIIVVIEGSELEVKDTIRYKIRSIKNIRSTVTLIVENSWKLEEVNTTKC